MKTLFLLSLLSFSYAHADLRYTKVISCDNDAVVIDRYSDHYGSENYQVVVHNQDIVKYFQSRGFFGNKESSSHELIYDDLTHLDYEHPPTYFSRGPIGSIVATLSENGNDLNFVVVVNRGYSAQWLFHNCSPTGD